MQGACNSPKNSLAKHYPPLLPRAEYASLQRETTRKSSYRSSGDLHLLKRRGSAITTYHFHKKPSAAQGVGMLLQRSHTVPV